MWQARYCWRFGNSKKDDSFMPDVPLNRSIGWKTLAPRKGKGVCFVFKGVTFVVAVLSLPGLFSCAPTNYAHRPSADVSQIEKKLAETNEKLEKLYQQVSLLQLMVDSQQRGKLDLKSAGSPPPSGISEESTADMPAPPMASERKPPSPAAITTGEKQSVPAAPKNLPEAETLYQKAYGIYEKHQYSEAAELFDTVAARYPNHDLADNALYWAGECRYATKDYAGALRSFMVVIKNYPNGNKAPDALLKAGMSYLVLGDTDNGVDYLKKVTKNYPFSTAAPRAEERLKQLKIQ
jgi:tol-pal system protein YbgF